MRFRKLKQQTKNKQKLQSKPKIVYANTPDRIKAFITDMFMIYVPILYIITYVFLDGKDDFQSSQLAPFIAVSLYGIIYALFVSKTGQTPGKKAYEIKVVDIKTHQTISFFRALLRFIVFLFSATILLGLLVQFFRKDNRSLHDLVTNTVVVSA
ncbi:FIG00712405: hypothetical protein [hydrothermal vent metagenome]|uniref:RDD domain-containing protein n=1 Tax=hydrothermal vent metagenome TaxID=652676 RepID=A0A1W1D2E5_9ZZZZ